MGMRHWKGDGICVTATDIYISPIVIYLSYFTIAMLGEVIFSIPFTLFDVPENTYFPFVSVSCAIVLFWFITRFAINYVVRTFEDILSETNILKKVLKSSATVISVAITYIALLSPFALIAFGNLQWAINLLNIVLSENAVIMMLRIIILFYTTLFIISFNKPIKEYLVKYSIKLINIMKINKLVDLLV